MADDRLARHLATLFDLKAKAGYSYVVVSLDALKEAQRAMDSLLEGMQLL